MFQSRNILAQTSANPGENPVWHVTCSWGRVSHLLPSLPSRSVDVVVVDTPRAASVALGAPRADAESTHVLCRHRDELTADFMRRVLRRIERIVKNRRVRSLWYVVGTEAARGSSSVRLLGDLLPMLDNGASLTVVGPGSHQGTVFEWIDSIMPRRTSNVAVRARLYTDGQESQTLRTSMQAVATAHAQRNVPSNARDGERARSQRWFPMDARPTFGRIDLIPA